MFSAGWYLQEGLAQPESIVFAACVFCFGRLNVHDPTALSQGDFSSRGQAGPAFLPNEGLGLEKFLLDTLHDSSQAPGFWLCPLLAPPAPPVLWQNQRQWKICAQMKEDV